MSSPSTTEAEVAPIWGRGDDAPAEGPIETTTVVSGTSVEDPSSVTASGASGATLPTAAALSGVGAPPMCATYGPYPTAPPSVGSAPGVGVLLEGDTLHNKESK
jgi:hypothetical protein